MIITIYRVYSGFRNVPDGISMVRPENSGTYEELRVELPDGYTVEGTSAGPGVFDAEGRHCELCLNNTRGTAILCCSATGITGLKRVKEDKEHIPLRDARLAAGLTQKQLADTSGVNVRQIQRVELGESDAGNLTAKNLLAIADALGVAPIDLI